MDDIQPSLEKGPQVQFRPTGVVSDGKTAKEVDFSRTTTAGTAATRKPSGGTVVPVEFKSLYVLNFWHMFTFLELMQLRNLGKEVEIMGLEDGQQ